MAGLLHRRGIIWAPDYIVGAGGVIYAMAVELDKETSEHALARVEGIADTVRLVLDTAQRASVDPAEAALELAGRRLTG